jgi:galactan endo-1,6-beta-galactosidase
MDYPAFMNNPCKILASVLAVAGFLGRAQALPSDCVLNPGKAQGTWDGWGTSLCWFANVFGDRDDVADVLFTLKTVRLDDQVLPGLGLNIVRYNAGGVQHE